MIISVIIPAYNEAERIGKTIQGIKQALTDRDFEIIVVDDGSIDDTSMIAERAGTRVITLPKNQGKGQAMNQGIKQSSGEVILLIDADLAESGNLITPLIEPILKDQADLSIAHFPGNKNGGFGLVKGLAHHGLYWCTNNRFYSPISGQRALKRQVVETLGAFKSGWGMEVAMTVEAHHHGFRIIEVPLHLEHRKTSRNWRGFLHRGEQFRDIFVTLVKLYWQYGLQKGGRRR